jgi:hypothetical protein
LGVPAFAFFGACFFDRYYLPALYGTRCDADMDGYGGGFPLPLQWIAWGISLCPHINFLLWNIREWSMGGQVMEALGMEATAGMTIMR